MSPEAVTGVAVDGRAEVFSLGVVLYEMLAGERPFGGRTLEETLASVLTDPVPSVAAHRPLDLDPVPPEVDALVTRALAKKPSERCTMLELYRGLSALLSSPTGELPNTLMSIVRPSKPRAEAPLSPAVGEIDALIDRMQRRTAAPTSQSSLDAPMPPAKRRWKLALTAIFGGAGLATGSFFLLRPRPQPPASAPIATPAPLPVTSTEPAPIKASDPPPPPPVTAPAPQSAPIKKERSHKATPAKHDVAREPHTPHVHTDDALKDFK